MNVREGKMTRQRKLEEDKKKKSGAETEEAGMISGGEKKEKIKAWKKKIIDVMMFKQGERDEISEKKQNNFLGENWSILVSF